MEYENYNNNDFNELEDLRQQITALKNKVNEQGRLNEGLVKEAIRNKMRSVHRTLLMLGVGVMFCIPLYIWMKYEENLSWALIIATIVLMLGSLISDYFINRIDVSHMGDDMVETVRKLTQMKKNRSTGQKIGMGVATVWLVWFLYEFYQNHLGAGTAAAWGSIIPLLVGALVGVIIGIYIYRKMQRANDDMINQIADLSHDK